LSPPALYTRIPACRLPRRAAVGVGGQNPAICGYTEPAGAGATDEEGEVPWYLTTPRQIKGFRRELNRVHEALSRQDVRGVGSPLTRMRGSLVLGGLAAAGLLAAALVVSLISPKPNGKVGEIMTTRSGGMFVMFNGRLHPVTNLASARLIVGKAAPATVVSDATLRSLPTGPLMGIPSAPNVLDPRGDSTASWTVCDWRDTAVPLSLLRAGDLTSAVIAGEDMLSGGDDLGSSRAVLARPAGKPGELWLIYRDTRAEVGTSDFAAQSALGITPALASAATAVSPSLLYAITTSPALTAPQLAERGQPSAAVTGSNIGDVLTVGTAAGSRSFYLVGRAGVQQIGPVPAQMMINTGSAQKVLDDPSVVQKLPRSGLIDDGRFPSQVPTLDSPASLCWNWSKSDGELTAKTRVFTGAQLPVSEAGKADAVTLLPNTGTEDQATESIMKPGYGWYARTTSGDPKSASAEGLMWIDPNGTRYPIDAVINPGGGGNAISYDPTVKALGFDSVAPTPIPWSVARLYSPGATLSIRNAQVMQGTITAISQVPSPAVTPGAAPPPPPPPAAPVEPAPAEPAPAAPAEPDPAADPAAATELEPAPAGN